MKKLLFTTILCTFFQLHCIKIELDPFDSIPHETIKVISENDEFKRCAEQLQPPVKKLNEIYREKAGNNFNEGLYLIGFAFAQIKIQEHCFTTLWKNSQSFRDFLQDRNIDPSKKIPNLDKLSQEYQLSIEDLKIGFTLKDNDQ